MNLQTIVNDLISDTLTTSLPRFRPELVLSAAIVVMLLAKVLPLLNRIPPFALALLGAIAAFVVAVPPEGLAGLAEVKREQLFTGMLVYDSVTVYLRLFLTAFAVLMVILSRLTGLADRDDGQDFYTLLFGATIGMCIMASSNHLLTLFLGVEMASVPSYVLAGVVKGRRRSSEAALKYAVYGAGAAGIMLYGASLLAGVLGTAHFPTMAHRLAELDLPKLLADGELKVMVLALGGMMMGVGLAFKLSAVPFHFWCPDVFEGAAAEIGGFLSVASKAAALALLLRVGLGLGYSVDEAKIAEANAAARKASANQTSDSSTVKVQLVAQSTDAKPATEVPSVAKDEKPLSPVRRFFVLLTAVVAVVTCTFGNLAAYGQRNIKRMLAYSTIAHAGYMMMPVAAAVAMVGRDPTRTADAVAALLLYATIYLFMNLGAFALVAFLRNSMQSEDLKDYAGLIRRSPLAAVSLTLILVSLIGLPPMAGFWPKLRVLQSLYDVGDPLLMFVLVVAAINTAISLVYYLRVAKTMCIDPEPDSSLPAQLGFFPAAFVLTVVLPVVVLGIVPDLIAPWVQHAAEGLF